MLYKITITLFIVVLSLVFFLLIRNIFFLPQVQSSSSFIEKANENKVNELITYSKVTTKENARVRVLVKDENFAKEEVELWRALDLETTVPVFGCKWNNTGISNRIDVSLYINPSEVSKYSSSEIIKKVNEFSGLCITASLRSLNGEEATVEELKENRLNIQQFFSTIDNYVFTLK